MSSTVAQPYHRPKGTAHVRVSKYRHIFGTPAQNHECILGLKVGAVQSESNVIKANPRFIAVPWIGSGNIGILNTSTKGNIHPEQGVLYHEDDAVNDFELYPFDDTILVSAMQSGKAVVWKIPEEGLGDKNLNTPLKDIQCSDKRLLSVDFHPLASNILLAFDANKKIKLFDIETSMEMLTLPDVHKALVTNVSWNRTGDLVASSCKDKTLRIFDARANKCVGECPDHEGAKGGRVLWLYKRDQIFTVGFGKGSDRQFALYDPRKLGSRLTFQKIDTSSSTIMPFCDQDNGILFLAGKGDGNIRYYEVNDEDPYIFYLNEFKSKDPQSGLALLPKQSCDVMKCEIARFIKLTPSGMAVPLRFEVPRQENHMFQEDIFPDTFDGKPSMTAAQWVGGANNAPGLMSLDPAKR